MVKELKGLLEVNETCCKWGRDINRRPLVLCVTANG